MSIGLRGGEAAQSVAAALYATFNCHVL